MYERYNVMMDATISPIELVRIKTSKWHHNYLSRDKTIASVENQRPDAGHSQENSSEKSD